MPGVDYSIDEAALVAKTHQMDPYHRDLMLWLIREVRFAGVVRDDARAASQRDLDAKRALADARDELVQIAYRCLNLMPVDRRVRENIFEADAASRIAELAQVGK